MKKDIHPRYHAKAKFTCACGAVLTTGATKEKISIEVCSQCHPFYTGKQRVVDSTGRVDRFKKLAQKASEKKSALKDVKTKEQKKQEKEEKVLDKAEAPKAKKKTAKKK